MLKTLCILIRSHTKVSDFGFHWKSFSYARERCKLCADVRCGDEESVKSDVECRQRPPPTWLQSITTPPETIAQRNDRIDPPLITAARARYRRAQYRDILRR